MKPEPKKKLPNKKVLSSAKFDAKEQFSKSALENLKSENKQDELPLDFTFAKTDNDWKIDRIAKVN